MLSWAIGGLGALFTAGGPAGAAVAGWTWSKVTQGIYQWLASGLALALEWLWHLLDSATTPRVTAGWFRNELAPTVMVIALAVTVAMMLASAAQAAVAGRPEQVGDAIKEGARAVVASALTITVIDLGIGVVDEASFLVWEVGREDLVRVIEGIALVAGGKGALWDNFTGPLLLLLGFIGAVGLGISLLMRNVLIYVVAAMAPLVWSSSVLPLFRGSARRLVHLLVALIFSKLAIVITLTVAVKLAANFPADPNDNPNEALNDAATGIGTLLAGVTCFLVAATSPFVLYKLMPVVENAAVSSGIAGGWGRSLVTAGQATMMAASAGSMVGAKAAASRQVAGQQGVQGAQGVQGTLTATGGVAGSALGEAAASASDVPDSGTGGGASGQSQGGSPGDSGGGSTGGSGSPASSGASASSGAGPSGSQTGSASGQGSGGPRPATASVPVGGSRQDDSGDGGQ